MVTFCGGKFRMAKDIVNIIMTEANPGDTYWEPFVGGGNVIVRPELSELIRYGSDLHLSLIYMYIQYQNGWIPPMNVSKEEHKAAKTMEECALKGFIGYCCSFSGRWFHGYRNSSSRNFAREGFNWFQKNKDALQHIKFKCDDYRNMPFGKVDIIYADPPYKGTVPVGNLTGFDSEVFWEWARERSRESKVYISEYEAPDDFECIFEKEFSGKAGLRNKEGKTKIEKLFVYKG